MYNPEYYQKNRDKIREKNKLWRENRIKNGLCIVCDNQISPDSKCLCSLHLIKNRERNPVSGRKQYSFYITYEEYKLLKQYLDQLRALPK
jgi:hypothetical protein